METRQAEEHYSDLCNKIACLASCLHAVYPDRPANPQIINNAVRALNFAYRIGKREQELRRPVLVALLGGEKKRKTGAIIVETCGPERTRLGIYLEGDFVYFEYDCSFHPHDDAIHIRASAPLILYKEAVAELLKTGSGRLPLDTGSLEIQSSEGSVSLNYSEGEYIVFASQTGWTIKQLTNNL